VSPIRLLAKTRGEPVLFHRTPGTDRRASLLPAVFLKAVIRIPIPLVVIDARIRVQYVDVRGGIIHHVLGGSLLPGTRDQKKYHRSEQGEEWNAPHEDLLALPLASPDEAATQN